ncbi:MAG: ArsR family transcriptional regulator [Saprospiraceae bacterium]
MIEALISSKTRIKLLLKFFLNSNTTSYLRGLESEFGDSSNGIRLELNKMEEAGMLESFLEGNKKYFKANTRYPLFSEIHSILLKYVGIDQVLDHVLTRLGHLEKAFLTGAFAQGRDSGVIDLILIGNLDKLYLINLIEKAEKLIKRKVRYVIYTDLEEFKEGWSSYEIAPFLIWSNKDQSTIDNTNTEPINNII